jgi:hypothetical protein
MGRADATARIVGLAPPPKVRSSPKRASTFQITPTTWIILYLTRSQPGVSSKLIKQICKAICRCATALCKILTCPSGGQLSSSLVMTDGRRCLSPRADQRDPEGSRTPHRIRRPSGCGPQRVPDLRVTWRVCISPKQKGEVSCETSPSFITPITKTKRTLKHLSSFTLIQSK